MLHIHLETPCVCEQASRRAGNYVHLERSVNLRGTTAILIPNPSPRMTATVRVAKQAQPEIALISGPRRLYLIYSIIELKLFAVE